MYGLWVMVVIGIKDSNYIAHHHTIHVYTIIDTLLLVFFIAR